MSDHSLTRIDVSHICSRSRIQSSGASARVVLRGEQQMKFGLNVINFGPSASAAAIGSTVEWAEAVGFSIAMLSDHVSVTPDVARMYPERFYEPFTTLAWLAARTTRIQLGTTVVIVPYRHPLLIERMTAQLQDFSGGRLVLGVGVGWARQEFAALGVAFEQRGRLTDAFLSNLPEGHPPIWVGGHSEAAIRRAGRFGDAWHPLNASLEWLAGEALPLLRASASEAGRPVPAFAPRIRVRIGSQGDPRSSPRPGQFGRDPSGPGSAVGTGCRVRDPGHLPG